MSSLARLAGLLAATLALAILSPTALTASWFAAGSTGVELQQIPDVVTMRLGISPGDDHQELAPGTDRRGLERALPELFEMATALGVHIDTVSVGRGFYAGDAGVEAETDLDLIVTGVRPNVLALGAMLGQRWDQSVVFAWENRDDGEMLPATGLLPGGAVKIADATLEAIGTTLPDGGHIRYAGAESALFVAHPGDFAESEFRSRLVNAQRILVGAGVRTGNLTMARATMTTLDRGTYQQFIDGAVRGKAAPRPVLTGTRG
jgi:hypothetical protein